MRRSPLWCLAFALLGSWSQATGLLPFQEKAEARLDRTEVPATGRQEALLTVSAFGRYSITAHSLSGTALQLVDRQDGPGELQGTPGEQDGRLDVFLDRGTYKVLTQGDPKADGVVKLEAHASLEKNAPSPPRLVEFKLVSESLADFEQRSYWLYLESARSVALEAAGRHLSSVRLWKDGTWLEETEPECESIEPKPGQPLLDCRFAFGNLEPGLYLVTAYGGPSQPWAVDDGTRPFLLRFGIPSLGEAGRQRHEVSAFGVDRWLAPGSATFFRLELPEARPASLQIQNYDPAYPFTAAEDSVEIHKDSAPPVAEFQRSGTTSGKVLVTVKGEAGQPYVLQNFLLRDFYPFSGTGHYWLSSIHSGSPSDSVDATALALQSANSWSTFDLFQAQAVELGSKSVWSRRFNALGPLSLYLHATKPIQIGVLGQGVNAAFRLERFFLVKPKNYKQPVAKPSGSSWELEAGYYVLNVEPTDKGILDLAIYPLPLLSKAQALLASPKELAEQPRSGSVRFGDVKLDAGKAYALYFNRQPGVKAGLIVRALPLDLTQPLPLTQRANEAVQVQFKASEPGTLTALQEDGKFLEVSVDAGAWQSAAKVAPGTHMAAVRYSGPGTTVYSLGFEPARLAASIPLPPLPEAALGSMPFFPVLSPATPQFTELEQDSRAIFQVKADEPALYQLQSTGLLSTEGNLRTRIIPSLFREANNGVGRNFLIQQYLRQGDYQLTVTPQEGLHGHMGVTLEKNPLLDGGTLTPGIAARLELRAGEAVAYRFVVEDRRKLRVRSLGLGKTFRCRLEDAAGWPLTRPNLEADFDWEFEPGQYRLILLPEPVASRRVTLLEPVVELPEFKGHGPHSIELNTTVTHRWLEPEEGQARTPDQWEFDVSAPVEADITLSNGMQGKLLRLEPGKAAVPVADLPAAGAWKGRLESGRHRIEAVCSRIDNRLDYQLRLGISGLIPGQSLDLQAPASVELSIGKDGLYSMGSFGGADVRARLYDAGGRLLASVDDRPEDWNFQIFQRLKAGRYRLEVAPVGASSASFRLGLEGLEEELLQARTLPDRFELALGSKVRLLPIQLPEGANFFALTAESKETVGCSLEKRSGADWEAVASEEGRRIRLDVPVSAGGEYRLRLWSLDRRENPATIQASAISLAEQPESALALDGALFTEVPGLGEGAALIRLERPGLFKLASPGLRWAAATDQACAEAQAGGIPVGGGLLWLAGGQAGAAILGERILLASGQTSAPVLVAGSSIGVVDLAAERPGIFLVQARSLIGQPGLRIVGRAEAGTPTRSGASMAVAEHAAAAVALSATEASALLWSAEAEAASLEAKLTQWSFAEPVEKPADWGSQSGSLVGVEAQAFSLPPGAKRVRMTLALDTTGVLSRDGVVLSVHWAGGQGFTEELSTEATRLTLLHAGAASANYQFEVLPLARPAEALAGEAPFEARFWSDGWIRLPVSVPAGSRLHVQGAIRDVWTLGEGGTVARGAELPAGTRGTLLLRHGQGPVLAWADRPGQESEALWGAGAPAPETIDTALPAAVPLQGSAQAIRLSVPRPMLLQVRGATQALSLLKRPGLPIETEAHLDQCLLDAYLPAGQSELRLRAFAGGSLSGVAELTAYEVQELGEGVGPEILLPPGATRFFSFEVRQPGPVGIGVRASTAAVESWLMDAAGHRLQSGVVQMPNLEPGRYLIGLRNPASNEPGDARPAVVGIVLPSTDPPPEVVEKYKAEPEADSAPGEEETEP